MRAAARAGFVLCEHCFQTNRMEPGLEAPACARCGGSLHARRPDSLARSWAHNRTLAAHQPDPRGLVQALRDDTNRRDDPLHANPLLQIELMLFVARTPELRPAVAEHVRTMRTLVSDIADDALRARGVESRVRPEQLGMILVALEDGLRLHRLIDPDSTPADAFYDALDALQQLAAPPAGT